MSFSWSRVVSWWIISMCSIFSGESILRSIQIKDEISK